MSKLKRTFERAILEEQRKIRQTLICGTDDIWHQYYNENIEYVSYSQVLRHIKLFLYYLKIEYANYLKTNKSKKKMSEIDAMEVFYEQVLKGTVSNASNFATCLRDDKYALIRELLSIAFPTGDKIKDLLSSDVDARDSICDEINICLLDKIYGNGNYKYISNSESENINNLLSSNIDLSIEEWVKLKIRQVEVFFFNGGVMPDSSSLIYVKYKNCNESQMPEYIKEEYALWKKQVSEVHKELIV